MRRIILKPGEIFSEDQLQRVGAFDAHTLTAATEIIEAVRTQGDAALRAYTMKRSPALTQRFRKHCARQQSRFAISTNARSNRAGSPSVKMARS